jgi:endonuclease/exonuclease/phosphatase family metal-dependent hydrolase
MRSLRSTHARLFVVVIALLAALGLACAPPSGSDAGPETGDEDAGPPDTGYPLPRDDAVASVGASDAIDIATWNIENFGDEGPATAELMADLITSMGLDLIAVEEIESVEVWTELADRLPYHSSALSSHEYSNGTYQKVGFLYRDDIMTAADSTLLFSGLRTDIGGGETATTFPRPPLQTRFTVDDGVHEPFDFTAIVVHLKAGIGNDDELRRGDAVEALADHVQGMIDGPADDDVFILGDFNETLTDSAGRAVFAPLLNDPDFVVQTANLAEAGATTYLPGGIMLDHIVSTAALSDELAGGGGAFLPSLTVQISGYQSNVSDHVPVVIKLPVLR